MLVNNIEQWGMFEVALEGPDSGNPFLDVTLSAQFKCKDTMLDLAGFYDGNGSYKIRCMPTRMGKWTYVTKSNRPELDGKTGEFICGEASASNHGPVYVCNTFHFAYADGTPYFPFGTTCYAWTHQGDKLEEQTLATLKETAFNKMRMCVFPKRYLFNSNEPPSYPFPEVVAKSRKPDLLSNNRNVEPPKCWDFNRFNPEYFQHLEKRILDLRTWGIEADLILFHPYDNGAWGFDHMPAEVNDCYLRYLVARLSAFRNLWWSFANEYDLMKGRTMEDWDHYFQLVQSLDPYNHLRSIHNCGSFYDHTKPWVTHCSIQHHAISRVPSWLKKYGKPVVIDECGYEGNVSMVWGDLSPEEMVLRFWLGFVQGGYVGHGETYVNQENVLWWSKGGQLHGESVPRIAFLRQIFEQAPVLTPVEKADMEFLNLMAPEPLASLFGAHKGSGDKVIAEGGWNNEAGGYNSDSGYYLFYFGMHQPASRNFNLQDDNYRIDLIDTWNMTIETVAEIATGQTCVEMPTRKFMAIRIQRNKPSDSPDLQ
ncbi:MAG: DUF5605 domain-containing protein [Anaerolineae bacterium]|nr:DUF5605 domain-containing protein [Anaerolineae bacterium]